MDFRIISNFLLVSALIVSNLPKNDCKIHELKVKNDDRSYISVSTFGFFKGGGLDVKLRQFHPEPLNSNDVYGFSIDRTMSDAVNPYLDTHQEKCLLKDTNYFMASNLAVVYLEMNLKTKTLIVKCNKNMESLYIFPNKEAVTRYAVPTQPAKQDDDPFPHEDSSEWKAGDSDDLAEGAAYLY
ncbi:unnamed protein product [Bemisia tabaci]|uniref:Uncharacterized protein n=1 Tax=Bemisia tabaci TaxID=7038 RepID=A0A9P0C2U6_BEMTA|nr:unnamed protein product [Bemisia tabaci]